MNDFHRKYGSFALITGASSGIGAAFAETLAARGFDLVITARRADRLEELRRHIEQAHGVRVRTISLDLAANDAVDKLLDATADLDVGLLVSNAGFGLKGDRAKNDPLELTDMLMVNCHVPLLLTHGFIPRLRARGHGGIILVSSVGALIGCPYSAAYAATKAWVKALGEGLWGELAPEDIDVLTLCPGATESEAAARSGVDLAKLQNVMPAAEVASLALENLPLGPTFISSEHYRRLFEGLLSMPRRNALTTMAAAIKGVSNIS